MVLEESRRLRVTKWLLLVTVVLIAVVMIVVATRPVDSGGLDPTRPISNACGENWNPRAYVAPDGSRIANLGCGS